MKLMQGGTKVDAMQTTCRVYINVFLRESRRKSRVQSRNSWNALGTANDISEVIPAIHAAAWCVSCVALRGINKKQHVTLATILKIVIISTGPPSRIKL